MIDNMELLRMIMENNPGQPASFILEQYSIYKAGLTEINSRFSSGPTTADALENLVHGDAGEPAPVAKPEKESLTRGYTKRSLKVKPDDAILDDKIFCCICGKECQTLTERHLATHNGLTREGYIKLCGYAAGQPLMSHEHLERMKANVLKAQQARKSRQDSDSSRKSRAKQEK